ncbi:UNVERIFIED_CONTAM: hypothetical protein GTU68_017949 [Idotea baltica]|nr:hypothetical protein [Idotea baltica]
MMAKRQPALDLPVPKRWAMPWPEIAPNAVYAKWRDWFYPNRAARVGIMF